MKLPVAYSLLSQYDRRQVRLQYIEEQGGLCCHCKGQLDQEPPAKIVEMPIDWSLFPKGFLKHPVHLHHDHDTDQTIGAVHAYCNAVLWQYYGE